MILIIRFIEVIDLLQHPHCYQSDEEQEEPLLSQTRDSERVTMIRTIDTVNCQLLPLKFG